MSPALQPPEPSSRRWVLFGTSPPFPLPACGEGWRAGIWKGAAAPTFFPVRRVSDSYAADAPYQALLGELHTYHTSSSEGDRGSFVR